MEWLWQKITNLNPLKKIPSWGAKFFQLFNKFRALYQTQSYLPHSQEPPPTFSQPQQDKFSPNPHNNNNISCLFQNYPHMYACLQVVSSLPFYAFTPAMQVSPYNIISWRYKLWGFSLRSFLATFHFPPFTASFLSTLLTNTPTTFFLYNVRPTFTSTQSNKQN